MVEPVFTTGGTLSPGGVAVGGVQLALREWKPTRSTADTASVNGEKKIDFIDLV